LEASALRAPAALSRSTWQPVRLLRLRSDEQLVALFRAGSEEAFGVIHDRYRQRLFAYTRQMLAGSRQDAEDALQDVFLRAYGALRANERPVSLRAWLYRVAHNRCIDQLRRPVPQQADVFDVSRSPLHDPLDEAQRREDLRRLVEDVRRLPEAQRSALLMREMEGLSYEELAGALDTTVPAIKSLLVRARIGLVEAVEARETACVEIREQLLAAYDKGVRASGQARRHMRECDGCREYRTALRGVQRSFAALTPAGPALGPLGLLAKLGLGGSSAGAGAGVAATGATSSGGVAGVCMAGGGAVTAGKVVAVVCSVAVVTAGAAKEVQRQVESAVAPADKSATTRGGHATPVTRHAPAHAALIAGADASPARIAAAAHREAAARRHRRAAHHAEAVELAPIRTAADNAVAPVVQSTEVVTDPKVDPSVTGGAVAPDEPDPAVTDPTTTTSTTPSDSTGTTPPVGTSTPPAAGPSSPGGPPAQQQSPPAQQPSGSATPQSGKSDDH
jgi:RNA polymerase sigma factor (sigma-70 family)